MSKKISEKKKKLIIILVVIGIVGSLISGLAAMTVYTNYLTTSLVGEFDKYVYLAEKLEDSSRCIISDEKNEIKGVTVLRDSLSDYCEKIMFVHMKPPVFLQVK